jgi:hypothetical protein
VDPFTSSFTALLETFSGCFRTDAFATFRLACVAWIVCPGTHTLSEVWQATGLAGRVHHDRLYSLFESAKWEWDELGKLLLLLLVARLVPTGRVWIVIDDTLAHKRGATVAFGGFFRDPVRSSRKYKNFRFGLDWVVLGLAVALPFRPERTFVVPVLWRVYRKDGVTGHRLKGQRLPTPHQMVDDGQTYPAVAGAEGAQRVVVEGIARRTGERVVGARPGGAVARRRVAGDRLDDRSGGDAAGDTQRWGIEVAFRESKQHLGLADPQVRTAASVERAHPLAFFLVSLTVLWSALTGKEEPPVERERPWYRQTKEPTFTDMLGTLRRYLWNERLLAGQADTTPATPAPEIIKMLLHYLSAVHEKVRNSSERDHPLNTPSNRVERCGDPAP